MLAGIYCLASSSSSHKYWDRQYAGPAAAPLDDFIQPCVNTLFQGAFAACVVVMSVCTRAGCRSCMVVQWLVDIGLAMAAWSAEWVTHTCGDVQLMLLAATGACASVAFFTRCLFIALSVRWHPCTSSDDIHAWPWCVLPKRSTCSKPAATRQGCRAALTAGVTGWSRSILFTARPAISPFCTLPCACMRCT